MPCLPGHSRHSRDSHSSPHRPQLLGERIVSWELSGLFGLTAADCQADGEDGQGDDAGDDEGKGGGEERLERPRVGLRGLQAPVAAVHCAAEKPGARGPAVLILGRGEVRVRVTRYLPQSSYLVNQTGDVRDNTRIGTVGGLGKTLMVDITIAVNLNNIVQL